MEISNEKLFELLVKIAGTQEIIEIKIKELETEIKFIKKVLTSVNIKTK